MENVFEWANSLDKNSRNKPNAGIQADLFDRISAELQKERPSYDDCVKALVKFDKKVLEPFYRGYYAGLSLDQQSQWDKALHDWADNIKPIKNATIRIVPIIRYKLEMVDDISRLEHELRWLSLHEEERSIQEFIQLRDRTAVPILQKLLALDLTQWRSGHAQIEKMYSILFSESKDETTQKLYADFLKRIGKTPSQEASTSAPNPSDPSELPVKASPDVDCGKVVAGNAPSQEQPEQPSEKGQPEPCPSIGDSEKDKPDAEKPVEQTPCEAKRRDAGEHPSDGIALAEALLQWTKGIDERCLSQARQIENLLAENEKSAKRVGELEAELRGMERALSEAQTALSTKAHEWTEAQPQREALMRRESEHGAEWRDMERALSEAQAALDAKAHELTEVQIQLESAKAREAEAKGTIERLQHMFNNSAKQELDGFKYALSSALKKTVVDAHLDDKDMSDAERAEFRQALFEELLDTLTHNGIVIEEN